MDWYRLLSRFRANGWMVAIHNDYKLNGTPMTFWLLTHPSGRFVKGEGETDEIAILECQAQMKNRFEGYLAMTDAAAMQKYTLILPVVMEGFPDAHHVFLQVMNQRFCVSPHGCDTLEDAKWLQDQLCIALVKIVGDSK